MVRMAFWPAADATSSSTSSATSTESIEVVVPDGDRVVTRTVSAVTYPVAEVLDVLAAVPIDADRPRSVRAWGEVVRVGLRLLAAGQIQPAAVDGFDGWVLGPLGPRDRDVRRALADWLPPEAFGVPVAGITPPVLAPPADAVTAVWNAIADVMPRTAAAGITSGMWAWAGTELTNVAHVERMLPDTGSGSSVVVELRLELPVEATAPFVVHLHIHPSGADDGQPESDQPLGPIPAADLWDGTAVGLGVEAEHDLLVTLRRGAAQWGPMARLLDQPTPSRLELDDREAVELMRADPAPLESAGLMVTLPDVATHTIETRAHVEGPERPQGAFNLSSACQLTWRAALDGEPLTEDELSELAKAQRPLVELRGQWVMADPELLDRLGDHQEISGGEAVAATLAGTITVDGDSATIDAGGAVAALVARLRASASPSEIEPPAALDATLRPYQRRGVAWLSEMTDLGLGGVLADDMGLGKTIQVIAVHLDRLQRQIMPPMLVVCPASVVGIWEHEVARFAPDLTVHRYHGKERTLDGVADGDVVVTTYGILRRDVEELAERTWGLVVADEAQGREEPCHRQRPRPPSHPVRSPPGVDGYPGGEPAHGPVGVVGLDHAGPHGRGRGLQPPRRHPHRAGA